MLATNSSLIQPRLSPYLRQAMFLSWIGSGRSHMSVSIAAEEWQLKIMEHNAANGKYAVAAPSVHLCP